MGWHSWFLEEEEEEEEEKKEEKEQEKKEKEEEEKIRREKIKLNKPQYQIFPQIHHNFTHSPGGG